MYARYTPAYPQGEMLRFYWVEDGVLAGCSLPGADVRDGANQHRPATSGLLLAVDLENLRLQGVGALLTLTEEPLDQDVLADHEITSLHLPVPDMTPPLPDQIHHALEFIDAQRAEGRAVAVHCLMGQGRTGTILAAYLIRDGMPASEAIARLREICPGAIGVSSQEQALVRFAERRDWVL
jgi:atypical dual specificity phosphatase